MPLYKKFYLVAVKWSAVLIAKIDTHLLKSNITGWENANHKPHILKD